MSLNSYMMNSELVNEWFEYELWLFTFVKMQYSLNEMVHVK